MMHNHASGAPSPSGANIEMTTPTRKRIGFGGMTTMTSQRLTIVLTAINLVLLVFLLAQTRINIGSGGVRLWTNIQGSVIRGRSLEIVDDEGRVRASIMVHPGDSTAAARPVERQYFGWSMRTADRR
jgi:hypothetical protein